MNFIEAFIHWNKVKNIQKQYAFTLDRVRKTAKKYPVKVAFIVRELSKWNYWMLYDLLDKDTCFEPVILVSKLMIAHKGKDKTRSSIDKLYNYFKNKGAKVEYLYKNQEYIDLKVFSPDIVVYDEPWDLPEIHMPEYVAKYALTYYAPYSYPLVFYKCDYFIIFYNKLFRYLCENNTMHKWYMDFNKNKLNNCINVGSIKLDILLRGYSSGDVQKTDSSKINVIYAPHHSFEKKSLNFATFGRDGKFILELAKKYPQTNWIFKPHPRFRHRLLRNKIMTENEYENFLMEWKTVGVICEDEDYVHLFETSDLMITDSLSFLAEYLTTQKPLIRLVNQNHYPFNDIGNTIVEGYYSVFSHDELEKVFIDLVLNKNDTKKQTRKDIKDKLFARPLFACEEIYNCMKKDLRIEL